METDTQINRDIFNRTKAPEMSSCVRSGDCASGLCCVRYLTGRRCQRIPVEGEACLLRGSGKLRRKLGRCDCAAGLSCAAAGGAGPGKAKGQGVCQPRVGRGQRNTRHSGKKRRTAERSC
ncbi:dickkopf-related protein 4-like [Cyclopterus lumpus]|uniref:dickkopf-related protein 4-like n=1 Tax=Cyclopterus lumpus TaxID=8103 RepID=UPI001486E36C|nr:dickkopf-related protein 4-like [Cyclopterus lumpus]